MSKALVRARGVATPDQFKTDWSQFMKQNIAMNIMIYPETPTMDKSSNLFSVIPAIPKAMIEKATEDYGVYVCVCFKDDTNTWQSFVLSLGSEMFVTPLDVSGNKFLSTAAAQTITIDGTKVTATKVYDVHFIYSDKEISVEVAENANDLPYVLFGPASEYVIEVTCAA